MSSRMIAALALVVFGLAANAQEETSAEEPEAGPWAGKVSLGYQATSGNTDNTSLNGSFEVGYTAGNWLHKLNGSAFNASESSATTAESYDLGFKSERNLSEFNYLFGQLDYRHDRFSGFTYQFSQTVGFGRRFLNTGVHTLSAEIGGGARQSETSVGVSENEFVVRGQGNYLWTISETANFTFDLVVEHGDVNTYMQSDFAVRARIVGNLLLVVSYTIKDNSEVPVGTENTDTFTALSLEYAF